MKLNEKIRTLREMRHWSQEEMAERLHLSKNGYGKIERGETRLSVERIAQLAEIFDVDIAELMGQENSAMIFVVGDNSGHNANYHGSTATIAAENEKLKLIIAHKDELLAQQRSEIATLKALVALLQERNH